MPVQHIRKSPISRHTTSLAIPCRQRARTPCGPTPPTLSLGRRSQVLAIITLKSKHLDPGLKGTKVDFNPISSHEGIVPCGLVEVLQPSHLCSDICFFIKWTCAHAGTTHRTCTVPSSYAGRVSTSELRRGRSDVVAEAYSLQLRINNSSPSLCGGAT
jgi:hypothetical protein